MKFKWSARKWRTYKFGKYEGALLGPSSTDSVAIFGKALGKIFYWVFLSQLKKWIFDQSKINLGEKTEEVTLVWNFEISKIMGKISVLFYLQ